MSVKSLSAESCSSDGPYLKSRESPTQSEENETHILNLTIQVSSQTPDIRCLSVVDREKFNEARNGPSKHFYANPDFLLGQICSTTVNSVSATVLTRKDGTRANIPQIKQGKSVQMELLLPGGIRSIQIIYAQNTSDQNNNFQLIERSFRVIPNDSGPGHLKETVKIQKID